MWVRKHVAVWLQGVGKWREAGSEVDKLGCVGAALVLECGAGRPYGSESSMEELG